MIYIVAFLLLFNIVMCEATQRGRPTIVSGQVRAENGEPLRGAPFFFDAFNSVDDMQAKESIYREYFRSVSRIYGINAVRIAPWMGTYDVDINNPTIQADISWVIDKVVTWSEEDGIYAIINQHSQYNTVINMTAWEDFWDIYAPLYKDETHIFFELTNEPEVSSADTNGTSMYNYVRALAPNTHLVLWSFASANDITLSLLSNHPTISYANASVGFHVYFETNGAQWEHMNTTIKNAGYPIFGTEHHSLTNSGVLPIDYNHLMNNIYHAENRGISWIQWAPYFTYAIGGKNPPWVEEQQFTSLYTNSLCTYNIDIWSPDPGIVP